MELETSGQDMPYTNRELREKWHDIANSLSTISTEMTNGFDEVKAKQNLTNGSVADVNKWRERINGGAIVAGFFMSVVVLPILCWAIYVLINIQETIHRSVDEALQAYNVNP